MNITLTHTEYLLTAHPCVVIDGFGAVLRRRRPARYGKSGQLLPPDYVYAFNPEIVTGDGLLASSIARAEGITAIRATALIQADVEAMRRQLAADGTLALGRIGTLIAGTEGRTLFRNYPADGLSPLASWLPVVAAPAEDAERADSENSTPAILTAPRRHRRLRRFMRAAAVVAAVAAAAIVTSTPITVDNANYASTSMPAVTAPRPAFVPATTPATLSLTYDGSGLVAIDTAARAAYQAGKSTATTTAAPASTASTTSAGLRVNENDPYAVIIASLTSREDAETFIAQSKARYGGRYGILVNQAGTRFRVYAATATTRADAQALVNSASIRRFDGAWYMQR